jgi:hypothetical protein
MKKKQSPVDKIINNFKNLIPYIGVLFVASGIIGLLFVQKPLQSSQDTRGEASTGNENLLKSCGEACGSNRDCMINFRCYQGACRLAQNPTSSSCNDDTDVTQEDTQDKMADETAEEKTATNEATVIDTDVDDSETNGETQEVQAPVQKGDNSLTDPDLEFKKQQNALADKKAYDGSYDSDETVLGLLKSLIYNYESRLPFFIILFGIMLLLISILATLFARLKRSKHRDKNKANNNSRKIDVKSYTVKPGEAPRNRAVKDLLKTLENQPKA